MRDGPVRVRNHGVALSLRFARYGAAIGYVAEMSAARWFPDRLFDTAIERGYLPKSLTV